MISRRNFLKGAGLAGGTLALVGCGGGGTDAATDGDTGSDSGELISVGIINNDPNESGYRTANDKDMKETFTEENGFAAEFAYSMKTCSSPPPTPLAGTPRSRTPRTPAPRRSCSTASSTPTRASTSPLSSPTWTPRARPPLTG